MSIDHPDYATPNVAGTNVVLPTTTVSPASGFTTAWGIFDLTSFRQVFLVLTNINNAVSRYTITWSSDPLGVSVLGVQTVYHSATGIPVYMLLDTQGPYLAVQVSNDSAGAGSWSAQITGLTSECSPALVVPSDYAAQGVSSVGANSNVVDPIPFNMPGRATLCGIGDVATWRVDVESWTGSVFRAFATVTNGLHLGGMADITIPQGDIQLRTYNLTAGAGNITRTLIVPAK